MLEDEEMPFDMEDDEEFDIIMADLIAVQEKDGEQHFSRGKQDHADCFGTEKQQRAEEEEEQRVVVEMADALTVLFEQGKSREQRELQIIS